MSNANWVFVKIILALLSFSGGGGEGAEGWHSDPFE